MNQWNQMADIFGCSWDEETIPECAADNICIAWPSLFAGIDKGFAGRISGKALDFGCGGGLLCRRLHEMGFAVTGFDRSPELLAKAGANTPPAVRLTDAESTLAQNGRYDLITSVMVFQFIEDIQATVDTLTALLKPGGLIICAVFNPGFLTANSGSGVFGGFSDGRTGFMELKEGVRVAVHSRSEAEYREIFGQNGCEQVYIDYPAFSREFLDKYPMPFATEQAEYLIQAFTNGKK